MVQGTTSSIELWTQKYYEMAKDIALGKDVTLEQTSIAANPADKSMAVPSSLEEQEVKSMTETKRDSGKCSEIPKKQLENESAEKILSPGEDLITPVKARNLQRSELSITLSPKRQTLISDLKKSVSALEAQTVTSQKEFQDQLDNLNAKLTLVDELSFLKDEIIKMKNMHKTEITNLKQEILSMHDENYQLQQKVTQLEQNISKSTATQKQIQTLHKKVESLEYTTDLIKDNHGTNMINPLRKEEILDESLFPKADPQHPFALKLSNTFAPLARDDTHAENDVHSVGTINTSNENNQSVRPKEPKENSNKSSMSNNINIQPNSARNIVSSQSFHDNTSSSIKQDSLASVSPIVPDNSSIENPDLILLIDSNGRHINMSKLLPRKKSVKVPCTSILMIYFISSKKHPSSTTQMIIPLHISQIVSHS